MDLNTSLDIKTILDSENIAEHLGEEDLSLLGSEVCRGFDEDRNSRSDWETRTAEANKLAMQVMEEKNYPWPGSSNVKFPLITISALQYHARAYPATIPGFDVVACRVIGEDPDGKKQQRADRVSAHMSYQRMEEDTQWEESHDKVLLIQAIVGCAFKKQYFDPVEEIQISELVLPDDLVVNYYTKSLNSSPRYTHKMFRDRNYCVERARMGAWLELNDGATPPTDTTMGPLSAARDQSQGMTPPPQSDNSPLCILEQYCFLDLDGDGYNEPYIVTVNYDTRQVLRVKARFVKEGIKYSGRGQIQRIKPENLFVKYPFIPSPDGGFYDQGFGLLLGGVSHSIDTLINLIIDQGHMAAVGGGFKAKGAKIRGGDILIKPNSYITVDCSPEDLQKSFLPLPVKEPNNTLYQALVLLIKYGTKIGMATDAFTGESPGQNTKVGVQEDVIAEGQKVFNAIFKRTFRAMKEEFRNLYRLNYLYPPDSGKFEFSTPEGKGGVALAEDYFDDDKSVIPTADPDLTNDKARFGQASLIKAQAVNTPGYDKEAVERNWLKAIRARGVAQLYPGPKKVAPLSNPKIQIEQIKAQDHEQTRQQKYKEIYLNLQEEMRVNDAKILLMEAQAEQAQAQAGDTRRADIVEMIHAHLDTMRAHKQDQLKLMEMAQKGAEGGQDNTGGTPGMAPKPGNAGVPPTPQAGGQPPPAPMGQ